MRFVRRALKVVLINLLLCVILLIPVELYFGTWLSGKGAISKFDAQPDTLEKRASPFYPPGTAITFRRDRYGLRGGPENPADIDVLAIGGSTTIERYLDEGDTWTAVLQRLLREGGCPTTIANAGIDGYSTAGNIASFDGWLDTIPGLKPRFVLVYVGINDAILNPRKADFLGSERYPTRWRQFEHFVAAHSALHRAYSMLRGALRARKAKLVYNQSPVPRTIAWQPAALPAGFAATATEKVAAYRQRLAELSRLIHTFGARPVYVTQRRADGRQVDGQWQQWPGTNGARDTATLDAIDAATLAFCHASGEACVDLAGQIVLGPGDFSDSIHTSPAGSARVAQFLADALRPLICPKEGRAQSRGSARALLVAVRRVAQSGSKTLR
jgi:lysophospholipase L1-like esterase